MLAVFIIVVVVVITISKFLLSAYDGSHLTWKTFREQATKDAAPNSGK